MSAHEITEILGRVVEGHKTAVEQLLPLVYDELRLLASRQMLGQGAGHTLQPTALVNEACVRLLGPSETSWESRAHFFAIAAKAMRQVLANHARGKRAVKRRPPGERITLSEVASGDSPVDADLLSLDEALTKLAALDERQSQLIELRFFGGMTIEEAALVMGISTATTEREWRMARAWLAAELDDHGSEMRP